MTISIEIEREDGGELKGTPGVLTVLDNCRPILKIRTLELDDNGNQKNISRIPEGNYHLHTRKAGRYYKAYSKPADEGGLGHDYAYIIRETRPARDLILIHAGNFLSNTRGCILVGTSASTRNGEHVVYSSKPAYNALYRALKPFYDARGLDTGVPLAIVDPDEADFDENNPIAEDDDRRDI